MEAWAASLQDGKTEASEEWEEKKLNIYEILGYALGCIGLSYDDFCRLTPEEFGAVVKKKMTPQALLPFEWDRQKPKAEFVSKEEDKKRLERLRGK